MRHPPRSTIYLVNWDDCGSNVSAFATEHAICFGRVYEGVYTMSGMMQLFVHLQYNRGCLFAFWVCTEIPSDSPLSV